MANDGVLKCPRCGKTYTKSSSLRRHEYYCRSKPAGPRKSRKRCCEACTRSKIRCDGTLPACSSCTTRGVFCEYADVALMNLVEKSDNSVIQFDFNDQNSLFNDASMILGSEAITDFALDSTNPTTIGEGLSNTSDHLNIIPIQLFTGSDHRRPMPRDILSLSAEESSFLLSRVTTTPTSLQWNAPAILFQRPACNPQQQMSLTMLTQIIQSVPYMMLQKQTFPPFIHAQFLCGSEEVPDILKNCMGLAQMFANRTPESSKIFWRAVRMELDRLFALYASFSCDELHAAVQAVLVYMTMRLSDIDPDNDGIEVPLFQVLLKISSHLSMCIGDIEMKGLLIDADEEKYWQVWLFQESWRRAGCFAKLMCLAFSADQLLCDPFHEFVYAPLPVKKTLWQASSESEWKVEYENFMREREIHGLTKKGKLVKVRQTEQGINSWETDWQSWYASQDGMGTMVMLAAQILQ